MANTQFKQQKLAQYETRKVNYNLSWKSDLTHAVLHDPLWCCFSAICPNCVSYILRKRGLYNDMSRYVCCNGDCPCSGRLGEQSCPELCLCAEGLDVVGRRLSAPAPIPRPALKERIAVFCCFAQSVASTRWMLQDEMHIQNTPCDNCLIGTMIFMQQLSCICNIVACVTGSDEIAALADVVEGIAHVLWVTVCACMQTQHKIQIGERDANPVRNPSEEPGIQAAPDMDVMDAGMVRPPMSPYMAPPPQAMPAPGQQGPFPPYAPAGGVQPGYPLPSYPGGQQMQR